MPFSEYKLKKLCPGDSHPHKSWDLRNPWAHSTRSNSPFHEVPVFAAEPVSDRLQRGELKESKLEDFFFKDEVLWVPS